MPRPTTIPLRAVLPTLTISFCQLAVVLGCALRATRSRAPGFALQGLGLSCQMRGGLYVDDLLSLFLRSDFPEAACLLIALLTCLNAPISWKKAQLGRSITWCGWTFDFETETVHSAHSKLAKLRTMLQTLLHRGEIQRKKLEAALGLLMWATTTCQHVRPYLAPLYRDLRSAVGTLKLIHPHFWQPFLDALDNSATVVAQPPGL